jgi:hypothetical protein
MDVSFPSEIESSNLFAGDPRRKPTDSDNPSRSNTSSSCSTANSSCSGSSGSSSTSNTSASSRSLNIQQRQHIRALERELERSEVVVAEALGETFRAREREAALRWRVGELEAMLGVGAGAGGRVEEGPGAGVVGVKLGVGVEVKADGAVRESEVLMQRLGVVMKERDEALRLLAEVRKVMHMAGAGGAGTS